MKDSVKIVAVSEPIHALDTPSKEKDLACVF